MPTTRDSAIEGMRVGSSAVPRFSTHKPLRLKRSCPACSSSYSSRRRPVACCPSSGRVPASVEVLAEKLRTKNLPLPAPQSQSPPQSPPGPVLRALSIGAARRAAARRTGIERVRSIVVWMYVLFSYSDEAYRVQVYCTERNQKFRI